MRASLLFVLASCAADSEPARPEPLAPLPPPARVETERFVDAETCAQCHLVADDKPALHDATGANVSPVLLWRSSLMALAARDPYYLAVVSEELARDPERRDDIEALCTRCHGPAGSEELADRGAHVTFDELVAGSSPAANLARGGVTCTLCHQITAASLTGDSAFSGGFAVGYDRKLFGPYVNPLTTPMQMFVNYEPALGAHVSGAELCGTCHTVILPTPSGEIVEQATFLEWRASEYASTDQPCQTCHVPTVDDQGGVIATPIASVPPNLAPRQPVGRHSFVGGNAYVLSMLADAAEWSGAKVPVAELRASAARDEEHLTTAARVQVRDPRREGDTLVFTVRVENLAGHKLPTGYPSRRVWLRVTARSGEQIVFQSGGVDVHGAIVDDRGAVLPRQPHRDSVVASAEVPIWEATLVDVAGNPTHRALDARRYSKDNRILPRGFAPTSSDRARTEPVGIVNDASFVPGADDVTYRLAVAVGVAVEVELLYQSVRPDVIDAIDATPTPAGVRFVDLARARPPSVHVIAHTELAGI